MKEYYPSVWKADGGNMDWKGLMREVRLLLLQLPTSRFWGVWLLLLVALVGAIYKGH